MTVCVCMRKCLPSVEDQKVDQALIGSAKYERVSQTSSKETIIYLLIHLWLKKENNHKYAHQDYVVDNKITNPSNGRLSKCV